MILNEQLEAAIRSIDSGNNGYADIGCSAALAEAVVVHGYVVIATRDPAPDFEDLILREQELRSHLD